MPAGLDVNEALAGMPRAIDRDMARRLLLTGEAAYLDAWHEANPPRKDA